MTSSYDRNNSDGKASLKQQRTSETTTVTQDVSNSWDAFVHTNLHSNYRKNRRIECQTIRPRQLASSFWTVRRHRENTEIILEYVVFVAKQLFLEGKRKLDYSSQPKPTETKIICQMSLSSTTTVEI